MKVSLFAPLVSPVNDADYVSALAKGAEARGFYSIWLGEHVVLFDNYDAEYPYEENGKIPVGGDRGLLEPITALSFMAAQTSRIRLGTGICLIPQRNPVYTAKEIAAVDYLSRGRVDFGVGVGWLEKEFTALGVPFARRGARCREYLEVIKSLWTEDVSSYSGEFYQLEPCRQYPKPVQQPGPPIYFGGESDAPGRRYRCRLVRVQCRGGRCLRIPVEIGRLLGSVRAHAFRYPDRHLPVCAQTQQGPGRAISRCRRGRVSRDDCWSRFGRARTLAGPVGGRVRGITMEKDDGQIGCQSRAD